MSHCRQVPLYWKYCPLYTIHVLMIQMTKKKKCMLYQSWELHEFSFFLLCSLFCSMSSHNPSQYSVNTLLMPPENFLSTVAEMFLLITITGHTTGNKIIRTANAQANYIGVNCRSFPFLFSASILICLCCIYHMQFYITFHPLFSETDKISDKGISVQSRFHFQ